MIQVGNIHIGTPQTAKPQLLTSGEAFALWDNLVARHDIIFTTKLYINHVHDEDFKIILQTGLTSILEKQVAEIEERMNFYKLPLPQRQPKSVEYDEVSEAITDEYIFKRLFTGIQTFIESHIRAIRVLIFNREIREMSIRFLKKELEVYDDMCKYGKVKGWLITPPNYIAR